MVGVNEPGAEPEGGDPACWAHEFEALLFGEAEPTSTRPMGAPSRSRLPGDELGGDGAQVVGLVEAPDHPALAEGADAVHRGVGRAVEHVLAQAEDGAR